MYLGEISECPPPQPGQRLNARGETVCQALERLNREREALPRAELDEWVVTAEAVPVWPFILAAVVLLGVR